MHIRNKGGGGHEPVLKEICLQTMKREIHHNALFKQEKGKEAKRDGEDPEGTLSSQSWTV